MPGRRNGQHRILLNKRPTRFIPKISEAPNFKATGGYVLLLDLITWSLIFDEERGGGKLEDHSVHLLTIIFA